MKVLHVLYQSAPDCAGSSTRSHALLSAQINSGIKVEAITSPMQSPNDLLHRFSSEEIDGVVYRRCYPFSELIVGGGSKIKKILAWPIFLFSIFKIVKKFRPNIIHAHSMYYCAIAAIIVGKVTNKKVIYEVRSRWEINPSNNNSALKVKIAGFFERMVCKYADSVTTISNGLERHIKEISNQDAVVVRNAISKSKIISNDDLKAKYANKNRDIIFGYVGSLIPLEGLNYVFESLRLLKDNSCNVSFIIYGRGIQQASLVELSKSLGISVEFRGVVKHEEIHEAYKTIDIIINYRLDEKISHEVTPLKPLEAMANGCLVLCSRVGGILEITGGEDNVIAITANSPVELAKVISKYKKVSDINCNTLLSCFDFLINERSWECNADIYKNHYINVLSE